MKDITKKYTNGEVTVIWQPGKCIHSENCFHGLSSVFNPNNRPWINAGGASTKEIVDQIKKCPSGALSYEMNNESPAEPKQDETDIIIEPTANGPLMVYGNLSVKHADGSVTKRNKVTAFCRCGASSNKPFCDGSHKKVGFQA